MELASIDFEDRDVWLYGFLIFLALAALYTFSSVFWTVLFSLSVVYVLYPLRRWLVDRGLSGKLSSAFVTLTGFAGVVAVAAPFLLITYDRRQIFIQFLSNLPRTFELSLFDFSYTVETSVVVELVQDWISGVAVEVASSLPTIGLKSFLVAFIVYAVLTRPDALTASVVKVFPDSMTPVLRKYHLRIRDTLYGIYVVQAATAFLTFLVALPVFWLLGYEAFFTLALLCGLLQFIPVVGPSVVIAAVAGFDLLGGMITRAFLVFVIGLLLIGALPDAVLRPRLANRATGLPASLYFLGFIGGVLTVGPIGIIVGPLVIALILETVELLADEP